MTLPQARLRDPITHVDTSGFMVGAVVGIVMGAVVVVAVVGSGGTLTVLGAVGYAVTGASTGTTIGEMIVDPNVARSVDGHITDGSPDTFVGEAREKAARASPTDPKTLVDCHGGAYVIQGSNTVFINRWSASRREDGTSCGGFISDGDPTVFTGGSTATLSDWGGVPLDANLAVRDQANLALSAAGLLAAPTTALGMATYAVDAISTASSAADVAQGVHPGSSALLNGTGAVTQAADVATGIARQGMNIDRGFSAVGAGTRLLSFLGG